MAHETDEPTLAAEDPEIAALVEAEAQRQYEKIRLIASENYVSRAVLEATGTVLTNKYSEGYAGKRYYEGQQVIDQIETHRHRARQGAVRRRARQRAALLGLARQPRGLPGVPAARRHGPGHGAADGGHLTHGWPVSATGKWFTPVALRRARGHRPGRHGRGARDRAARAAQADHLRRHRHPAHHRLPGLRGDRQGGRRDPAGRHRAHRRPGRRRRAPDPGRATPTSSPPPPTRPCAARAAPCCSATEEHAKAIDKAVFPGLQGGPHNHTTAGIAVALDEAAQPDFKDYAAAIVANAKALAAALTERGFDLVSGGTDNHLLLVDLTNKGVTGKVAAKALDAAGIELNFNAVPFDPRRPSTPPACAWARPRSPPAASAPTRCRRSPPGSTRCCDCGQPRGRGRHRAGGRRGTRPGPRLPRPRRPRRLRRREPQAAQPRTDPVRRCRGTGWGRGRRAA